MVTRKKTEKNVMGVKSLQGRIKFEFPAPEAKEVSLVGDFNQWNSQANPMKKDKKGIWKTTLSLKPGSSASFRFFNVSPDTNLGGAGLSPQETSVRE